MKIITFWVKVIVCQINQNWIFWSLQIERPGPEARAELTILSDQSKLNNLKLKMRGPKAWGAEHLVIYKEKEHHKTDFLESF